MTDSSSETTLDAARDIITSAADSAVQERDTQALLSFRDQVTKLIAPYQSRDEEPPFVPGELIAIVLIFSDEEFLPPDEILKRIITTFPFYQHAALKLYAESAAKMGTYAISCMPEAVPGFRDALTDFDLPLQPEYDNYEGAITTSGARMCLKRWFEPERKGTFPFLDLPPELRNRIYEMLFRYPKSGIAVSTGDSERLNLIGRADSSWTLKNWDLGDIGMWYPEPVHVTLAILLTNKQVFKEAMPMFYGLNSFYFDCAWKFIETFDSLPATRTKHFKNIHFGFWSLDSHEMEDLQETFSTLADLTLDVLMLSVADRIERVCVRVFCSGKDEWKGPHRRIFQLMVDAAKKAKRFELNTKDAEFRALMASKVKVYEPIDMEEDSEQLVTTASSVD